MKEAGSALKDIATIRARLRDIRYAIDDVPPNRPRFGGSVLRSASGEIIEFDISSDDGGEDALAADREADHTSADLRDRESLFRELDSAWSTRGIDALAWYHPFHLSGDRWGIYVPLTTIHYGAERWFGSRRLSLPRRAALAFQFVLGHEVIHHACEYAVSQYELVLRASCWAAARDRIQNAQLEWFDTEEALANAHGFRKVLGTRPRVNVDWLRESLRQSPTGYRDYELALSDEGFQDHLLEVLRHNIGIPSY